MAAQARLCLAWSETPEDTFSHGLAHMYMHVPVLEFHRHTAVSWSVPQTRKASAKFKFDTKKKMIWKTVIEFALNVPWRTSFLFQDSWWGGARGQNLGCLLEVIFCFSFMRTIYGDSWSAYDIVLYVMMSWSVWPIFHCRVIMPCILKILFDGWTSNFWRMSQRDQTFDLKIDLLSQRLFDRRKKFFG